MSAVLYVIIGLVADICDCLAVSPFVRRLLAFSAFRHLRFSPFVPILEFCHSLFHINTPPPSISTTVTRVSHQHPHHHYQQPPDILSEDESMKGAGT